MQVIKRQTAGNSPRASDREHACLQRIVTINGRDHWHGKLDVASVTFTSLIVVAPMPVVGF